MTIREIYFKNGFLDISCVSRGLKPNKTQQTRLPSIEVKYDGGQIE